MINNDEMQAAEKDMREEALIDWQIEEVQRARYIPETNEYAGLPGWFEIGEYELMKNFCQSIDNDSLRHRERASNRIGFALKRAYCDIARYWCRQ